MSKKILTILVLAGMFMFVYQKFDRSSNSTTSESVSPLPVTEPQTSRSIKESKLKNENARAGRPQSDVATVPKPTSNPYGKPIPAGDLNNKDVTYMGSVRIVWMTELEASRVPYKEFIAKARFVSFETTEPSEARGQDLLRIGIDYKDKTRTNLIANRVEATDYLMVSRSWFPEVFPTTAFETEEHYFFSLNSDPGFTKGGSILRKKTGECGFWLNE